MAGARLSLPPRLCDNNLLHLLLAQEAVGPLGDAPGSEPGAPGSGHWPATFLSQLFASARRGFLIGEMGSIHPFFSENILKAWLTATQITSPGLLSPCEWTPQGRKPSGRAESLEAAGMESERSRGGTAPGAQCRQRLVPGGLRALIPPQAGALSTSTRVVQLSVPGTQRGSRPALLLQGEQNRGLRGCRDMHGLATRPSVSKQVALSFLRAQLLSHILSCRGPKVEVTSRVPGLLTLGTRERRGDRKTR